MERLRFFRRGKTARRAKRVARSREVASERIVRDEMVLHRLMNGAAGSRRRWEYSSVVESREGFVKTKLSSWREGRGKAGNVMLPLSSPMRSRQTFRKRPVRHEAKRAHATSSSWTVRK